VSPLPGTSTPWPVVRRAGALEVYREHLRNGRRYSLPAYVLGSLLRHRCASAGAVARLRGWPGPRIEQGEGEIHVGAVGLYPGVHLKCAPGGVIRIGDGTYLNRNTRVYAEQEVSIGADAMIAWDVIITDTSGFGERPGVGEVEPVHVGDRAWIGAKAVLVAGARIGDGAVVAAGAVVDHEVEPGAIVTARAARKIFDLEGGAS